MRTLPRQLYQGLTNGFTRCEFRDPPLAMLSTGAAPGGTAGNVNNLLIGGVALEYFIIGAGQTLVVPTISADGLLASLDLTAAEGVEYSQGITAWSRAASQVGQDAFSVRLTAKLADVSGLDEFAFGLRKAAAYNAVIDDYTDGVFFNVQGGDIKIETILNNAATVTTDTTNNWADGEVHTLEVRVSAARQATFLIDGAAPLAIPDPVVTFDNGDIFVPFCHILHGAAAPGAVHFQLWEAALL